MGLFSRRCLEAHGGIRGRAAALERLMTNEASSHGETLRVDRAVVNPVLPGVRYCIWATRVGGNSFCIRVGRPNDGRRPSELGHGRSRNGRLFFLEASDLHP